jgi:hypothetical protein
MIPAMDVSAVHLFLEGMHDILAKVSIELITTCVS